MTSPADHAADVRAVLPKLAEIASLPGYRTKHKTISQDALASAAGLSADKPDTSYQTSGAGSSAAGVDGIDKPGDDPGRAVPLSGHHEPVGQRQGRQLAPGDTQDGTALSESSSGATGNPGSCPADGTDGRLAEGTVPQEDAGQTEEQTT